MVRDPHRQPEHSREEAFAAVASLLATGLLRWHQQRRLLETRACPDSSQPGLEHVAETALSVVTPVYGPETTTISEGECK
jgi:hypothetical protein